MIASIKVSDPICILVPSTFLHNFFETAKASKESSARGF